ACAASSGARPWWARARRAGRFPSAAGGPVVAGRVRLVGVLTIRIGSATSGGDPPRSAVFGAAAKQQSAIFRCLHRWLSSARCAEATPARALLYAQSI